MEGHSREPDYQLVAQRLRRNRKRRGLDLRAAAAEMGVSAPTLSRIERGVSKPDASTLNAVVDWLGLDRSTVYRADRGSTESLPDVVNALIEGDPQLDAQAARTLSSIFRSAYRELAAD